MITQQMYHPVKNVLGVNLSAVDHMDLNKPWPFFHSIIWGKESEVPLFFFSYYGLKRHSSILVNQTICCFQDGSASAVKKKKNYNRLKHTKC